jgi:CO/xanthine dehydrogenase Mo-binding subunit
VIAPDPLSRWPEPQALHVAGHPAIRASGAAKVTGRAEFSSDIVLPGLVHACLIRSTIPRGEVTTFNAHRAYADPDVLLVLGPFDQQAMPGIAYYPDPTHRTRPALDREVRFVGEEIGVVAATTEAAARTAATMIEVGYRSDRPCLTIEDSLSEGAPSITPEGNIALGLENIIERGDFSAAEAFAEVVVEGKYSTEAQHHNPLEPHGCVASWNGDILTLWDSSQGGHMVREQMARTLGIPIENVQVISRYVGGGFGSKIHMKPYHVVAAEVARRLGRPVRLFMSRREEFIASHQRAPTRRHIRLGATRNGRLCFIDQSITGQAGPSNFFARNAAGAANGLRLHKADAIRATLRRVLTNTQAPIPFRGPTAAEDIFCLEQAVDELAHALEMCPLEFRRRNIGNNDPIVDIPYAGKDLDRCYDIGAETFGWTWRPPGSVREGDIARGIGLGAAAYDGTLYEASKAEVNCLLDGRIEVQIGVTEIGCGADTIFAQIAAEELGLPLSLFTTHFGDTDTTPRSIDSTNHSRTTTVVGPVVRRAANFLRTTLLEAGAKLLQARRQDVELCDRGVSMRSDSSRSVSFTSIAESNGGAIVCAAERERAPEGIFPAMFAAHFVEVEVNTRTGRVSVTRAVCAHDAGRVINPLLAESQVHGGFLQGMGMALQEQRVLDPRTGHMLNATMWAYRTPSIVDAPVSIRFVNAGRPDGANSLGVKGIGEPPLIASGAAIGNAVYNAIGVRIRSYPITPEKVLAALEGAAS